MDRLRKAAVLSQLAQMLHDKGSWCGETHLQKATYFLQQLLKAPLGYEFILYKHGPFSFDLRAELTALQADELFGLKPQPVPYGPKLLPTERARQLRERYPKTLGEHRDALHFVVEALADKNVSELERLATALYVTEEMKGTPSIAQRAQKLHDYKPHVSVSEAQEALRQVDKLRQRANSMPR